MKIIEITRMEDSPDGCFGVLRVQKQVFCLTLEPPDQGNKPWISCIPVQQYICTRYESPQFGQTYIVTDVPDREHIVFHWGNWVTDTQGCILLGSAMLNGAMRRGVANSRDTFERFMGLLAGTEELHLTISTGY